MPIQIRQPDIQQHCTVKDLAGLGDAVGSGTGSMDAIAFGLEHIAQCLADIGIVIHDQDIGRG